MTNVALNIKKILKEIPSDVTLIAVSKTKPVESLKEAYNAGQRDFGENKVQELCEKQEKLPNDIRWHMIGHLQSNKVKYIVPFVYLIHGVDSVKLLAEINKRAKSADRIISVLLQMHISDEETKFGFDFSEIESLLAKDYFAKFAQVKIKGLMGMASNTKEMNIVANEFSTLHSFFEKCKPSFGTEFNTVSMGMSGDYTIAIEKGSTMIRVGSKIFGSR